jgi:hypothetical protein
MSSLFTHFSICCSLSNEVCRNIATNEKGLAFVGEFEFRLPITEVDNCNIADVLFISQIYNVKPELNHNKEQMLRQYSSSPNNAKPNVGCSAIRLCLL